MDNKLEHKLSLEEAYRSMFAFLEKYYEATKSDEIGGLLGSMAMTDDGKPMDPAFWEEWVEIVATTLKTIKR